VPSTEVFDDRIGLKDIGSNVVGVGPISRVERSPVKEANGPRFRRFGRKAPEECAESGVNLL
jgi:hypothetical protein